MSNKHHTAYAAIGTQPTTKTIHISPAKFFHLFYSKNLLFLFYTTTFPEHPHQFIYFTNLFYLNIIIYSFLLLFINTYLFHLYIFLSHLKIEPSLSLSLKYQFQVSQSSFYSLLSHISNSYIHTQQQIWEDLAIAIVENKMVVDRATVVVANRTVDPAPLGFSCEFSVEYGLGWVF